MEAAAEQPTTSGVSREKDGEMCCKVDEILCKNPEMRIIITNAGKASDGGANFIAYTIEVGVHTSPQSIRLTIGNDVETTIFGICVI